MLKKGFFEVKIFSYWHKYRTKFCVVEKMRHCKCNVCFV